MLDAPYQNAPPVIDGPIGLVYVIGAMNLKQTITPSPDVIFQEVSGEAVLLDLKSENYFGLDAVGTRIWQLIQEHGDLQLIYSALLEEYDVEEDRLLADFEILINEVCERGLVTLQGA